MTARSLPRILIAGIGNIFLGDDAFGVEVVRRLAGQAMPPEVRVVDFGIRGLDLAYALLDGWEVVILVDAAPRGGPPGTLYVIEPSTDEGPPTGAAPVALDTHAMDPAKVLRFVSAMGGKVDRLLLVGCEPVPPGDAMEMQLEMSPQVRAAVDPAVQLVQSLIAQAADRREPVT